MSKKIYEVIIGYRAVITVRVKASSEEEAKQTGLNTFKNKEREKWFKRKDIHLQDDSFKVSGVVNMDETWNML